MTKTRRSDHELVYATIVGYNLWVVYPPATDVHQHMFISRTELHEASQRLGGSQTYRTRYRLADGTVVEGTGVRGGSQGGTREIGKSAYRQPCAQCGSVTWFPGQPNFGGPAPKCCDCQVEETMSFLQELTDTDG